VGKSKRSRRPGGHPAKVAQRRERDGARNAGAIIGPDRIARQIVRDALRLPGPLDAELWGSSLLGSFWDRRYELPVDEFVSGAELVFGGPLVEAIRQIGGPGARIALAVIGAVDYGELGLRALQLAAELSEETGEPLPDWVAEVGKAMVTGAALMSEGSYDDACTVFLEARHLSGEVLAVGVRIDNNLGGMADDVLLADSIDRVCEIVRDHPPPEGDVRFERIAPGGAAGRIGAALKLTDDTWHPPVSDDFAHLRALARMRADATPDAVVPAKPEEMSRAERDRLRDEFLHSPEGNGLAPDGEEAYAVSLAIDFCVDYVDGRPLRWSPTVVELFMADWVPRKVMGDDELFASLPSALDAWVRFAGRKSGLAESAIAATQQAIPTWREAMVEHSEDPDAAGPAKQFLSAARKAGIDLEDENALNTFVAGWNARNVLD
jgi:hypothetical protein